jgi:hypothetical protein
MLDKETSAWLAEIFNRETLSVEEIHKRCSEIMQAKIPHDLELIYELSQASSDAAFYLMQLISQKEIAELVPQEYSSGSYFALSSFFPFIIAKKFIVLKNSQAFADAQVEIIDRPQAFRIFQWGRCKEESLGQKIFSFDSEKQIRFVSVENKLLMMKAALVAGLMKKSYELSYTFTYERSQGGRLIKDWSLIQQMLSEIYLQVKVNERLMNHLTIETALAILKSSDRFESQCMQIMGGAGYTEDYILEKHFREIHFLKNWPDGFVGTLQRFYTEQVMSL